MSSYYYICVVILLYMCRHTTICVLILRYMRPHSIMCPHTTICVLILLYMCPHRIICVLMLLYMCPHTTMYVYSTGGRKFQLFFFFFVFIQVARILIFFLASYRWLQISTPNTQLPGVWPMQSHSWAWYNYVYIINKNKKAAAGYAVALMGWVQLCIYKKKWTKTKWQLPAMQSHSWAWYNCVYMSSFYN